MSFLGEIKRRKVFQVAAVYAVVAWLIMQVVDVVSEPLLLPDWFPRVVILLLAIGFPISLVLSWAFDITPQGVLRDEGSSEASSSGGDRRIEFVLIGLLVVAVGWIGFRELGSSNVVEVGVLPNSVAILPFENLSPDPNNSYFADGIHESTLTQLANIGDLAVIGRNSVLRFEDDVLPIPEIANLLNVETVMNGSVRFADDRVRITARLLEGATGRQMWAGEYERELLDIFAVQAEIARNIAIALEAELLPSEIESIEKPPTDSPVALGLYLRAVAAYEDREYWEASLNRALELDENFALAHAEIAENYAFVFRGIVPGWEELVRVHSEAALDLDPSLTRAQMAQALALEAVWLWEEAEEAFNSAYRSKPGDADVLLFYGRFKRIVGDYEASAQMLRRAIELDPAGDGYIQLGLTYKFARQYRQAADAFRSAIELSPAGRNLRVHLADVLISLGDTAEALEELRTADSLAPGTGYRLAQTMHAYSRLNRTADVERVHDDFEEFALDSPVGDATRAITELALGNQQAALEFLRSAEAERTPIDTFALVSLEANPWRLIELEQPAFREILDRVAVATPTQ